jgi:hypothetical protein
MHIYDQLIAQGFERDPSRDSEYTRYLIKRAEVDGQPVACGVTVDIEESGFVVTAISGPMVHEWHATFTDGAPRALVMAAVTAALAGQTDDDEEDDVALHN